MIKNSKNKFLEQIGDFNGKNVLVIGDIMLDEYIWGSVERISPEAPVPVVFVEKETRIPGGATNVVNNLVGLGAKVYISGIIGNDDTGSYIRKYFNKKNVELSGLVVSYDRPTTLKTRIIAHNQQVVRVDKESSEPVNKPLINEMIAYVKKVISRIDGIIISDYGKGVIVPDLIEKVITIANENKKVIAVDPKIEHFFQYKNVTLITPNHFETERALNIRIKDQNDINNAGKEILKQLNLQSLFITQSKEGMTVFQKGKPPAHIPTHAKKVYDVTGAGDTVISTALMALVSSFSFEEAAMLSNYAAGIVVGEVGTTVITLKKLKEALKSE
ncbi:MAG: D-glycero-beta-D-manno-heptose-7-phosphate kinase [Spirochaetes bacterium]|nr:D-glycero-beta-D-manno-heptose-7-phosphate kinase [Spirochaetota bacterium]